MIEAILLAAGQSSRMGRDKALLPMNKTTVVSNILDKLLDIADCVTVILGDNYQPVSAYLEEIYADKVNCIFNENHYKGMYSSAKKGFGAVSGNNPIVFQLIDQPFVPLSIYQQLAKTYQNQLIYQPSVKIEGRFRAGHPIIFSGKFKNEILQDKESENLRELINRFSSERAFLLVQDSAILDNLNTYKEYNEKLIKRS